MTVQDQPSDYRSRNCVFGVMTNMLGVYLLEYGGWYSNVILGQKVFHIDHISSAVTFLRPATKDELDKVHENNVSKMQQALAHMDYTFKDVGRDVHVAFEKHMESATHSRSDEQWPTPDNSLPPYLLKNSAQEMEEFDDQLRWQTDGKLSLLRLHKDGTCETITLKTFDDLSYDYINHRAAISGTIIPYAETGDSGEHEGVGFAYYNGVIWLKANATKEVVISPAN